MYKKKVLGDSRILKSGMVTIPKRVRDKLSVKDGEFLTYLESSNGNVEIKKLELDLNERINLIPGLKRQKLL